jgi:hypothetical protein
MGETMAELENAILAPSLTNPNGTVSSPTCCGQTMADDGGCSQGCCDDFKCDTCGKKIRVEWPD